MNGLPERGARLSWSPEYGYATSEVPGVEFEIKTEPEDFRVDEVPLFGASGEGEHTLFLLEKRGISTWDAIRRLSSRLGIPATEFGYAGLKDARAVTSQQVSVRGVSPKELYDRLQGYGESSLQVRDALPHDKKLRVGQSAGNRFRLVLRGLDGAGEARVRDAVRLLQERGLPNFYGEQRFGLTGDGHELGRKLVEGDLLGYLIELCGPKQTRPTPATEELAALLGTKEDERDRSAFRSRLRALAKEVPGDLARFTKRLANKPEDYPNALRGVSAKLVQMHVSSLQSMIFNRVLGLRLREFGDEPFAPRNGDVVQFAEKSACFVADLSDPDVKERAERGELLSTGPLPGWRLLEAQGLAGELERRVFEEEGITLEQFKSIAPKLSLKGARRVLSIPIRDLEVVEVPEEARLALSFRLPPGAYATSLVEELRKRYVDNSAG